MKKFFFLFIVMLIHGVCPLHAAEIEPQGTPARKLQRGFLNVALSPIEIAHHLDVVKTKDTFPPSWVFGVVKGGSATVGRSLIGIFEILTFGIETPAQYAPIVNPEFTWEYFSSAPATGKSTKVQS